jgi:hypothetical protein
MYGETVQRRHGGFVRRSKAHYQNPHAWLSYSRDELSRIGRHDRSGMPNSQTILQTVFTTVGGTMRTMPSLDYKGYAVAVNALPAAENRYYSIFAIHRHVANSLALQTPAAWQQGIEDGVICDTTELAYQDARDRARNWIDAHPVREAKHSDIGTYSASPPGRP